MSANYRLTAFSVEGPEVKRVDLDRGWLAALRREGFEARTADAGEAIMVTVVALTRVELARVNAAVRKMTREANTLQCCDRIDEVIRWAGQMSYFSPWFVIESADID